MSAASGASQRRHSSPRLDDVDLLDISFPDGPPPRSPKFLSEPALKMPTVFVISPEEDGANAFCAFDSDACGPDPPSPTAPDFGELEKALDFLQNSPAERKSSRRRSKMRRSKDRSAESQRSSRRSDSVDVDVDNGRRSPTSSREVSPAASTCVASDTATVSSSTSKSKSSTAGKSLRHRASRVLKLAFGNTEKHDKLEDATVPIDPSPDQSDKADPSRERLRHKSSLPKLLATVPTLFHSAPTQTHDPADPNTTEQPTSQLSLRRRLGMSLPAWLCAVPPNTPPHSVPKISEEPEPQTRELRRRPFSVLGLNRQPNPKPSKPAAKPGLQPFPSTDSPSRTTFFTTTSANSSSIRLHSQQRNLMTRPFTSDGRPTRLDSFHFDSSTLFDPYKYSIR